MEVAGWREGELASGLSTALSGICQRAEEEWSNTSHSFSRPRSAVRQQLILIGGNVQRGKEDIVSTCSRSVVYFNYFLINLNGSSVTSCDVKKVLDMQIKTECDSCMTVTSCAEQQDISFALLCSKRVSGGQVVTFWPHCWCISYFLQGSESILHVGMEFKQYNHLKVPFQVTSILHRPPLSFLPCPVLSQLFYSKCAWELLHI